VQEGSARLKATSFMQIPITNSNLQRGVVLVFTLIAILLLTLIATAMLQSQRVAIQANNQFLDVETTEDAVDFCVQAAFDKLSLDSLSNTFNVDPNAVVTISASTKVTAAFNNTNTTISKTRISNSSKMNPTCTLQFIKQIQSVSSSGTGQEISSSRSYATGIGSTVKYYRITAIQDNQTGRVEYQVVLAI
jgi:Tfp pilus assembly protein PilX